MAPSSHTDMASSRAGPGSGHHFHFEPGPAQARPDIFGLDARPGSISSQVGPNNWARLDSRSSRAGPRLGPIGPFRPEDVTYKIVPVEAIDAKCTLQVINPKFHSGNVT